LKRSSKRWKRFGKAYRRKSDAVESPAWHEKELRDRERDIESGKSKFIDWEKAKADIRRQTS
jgi:hypothetical protein